MMLNSDGFFYQILTLMMDSYNLPPKFQLLFFFCSFYYNFAGVISFHLSPAEPALYFAALNHPNPLKTEICHISLLQHGFDFRYQNH